MLSKYDYCLRSEILQHSTHRCPNNEYFTGARNRRYDFVMNLRRTQHKHRTMIVTYTLRSMLMRWRLMLSTADCDNVDDDDFDDLIVLLRLTRHPRTVAISATGPDWGPAGGPPWLRESAPPCPRYTSRPWRISPTARILHLGLDVTCPWRTFHTQLIIIW